jgi:hypothetical protein
VTPRRNEPGPASSAPHWPWPDRWRILRGQTGLLGALEALEHCLERIPRVYVGSVAGLVHGQLCATHDIDLCVPQQDVGTTRSALSRIEQNFGTGDTVVRVHAAGSQVRSGIAYPGPEEADTSAFLPVVSLRRLVELELARGRYRDWANVVEMIRKRGLGEDVAGSLAPSVRSAHLQCRRQRGEEDRHDPQMADEACPGQCIGEAGDD